MKTKLLAIALVLTSALYPLATLGATKQFQVDTGNTLTTSLVSYYKLEDANDFWSTNNLTNFNSVTFVTGKVNNAASFNGTTNYLQLASPLSTAIDNISIFFWVNIPTASEKGIFFHNGLDSAGTVDGYSLGVGSGDADTLGNHLIGLVDQVAWMDFGTNIGTGWHFVGMIRNAGTWTGYIDNAAAATTFTTVPITPSGNFQIGVDSPANSFSRYWKDKIDEFGFWTKVLSSQERTDLYNGGAGQTMILFTPTVCHIRQIGLCHSANSIGGACFVAGTKIKTPLGLKNIEELKVGDYVLSYDTSNGTLKEEKILKTFIHETNEYVLIKTKNKSVETTKDHPFLTTKGWKKVSELHIGDTLITNNGKEQIENMEAIKKANIFKVYNLEVEGLHNYIANGFVVHNKPS